MQCVWIIPKQIPPPQPWKNCLPQNRSLVPKILGTADAKDVCVLAKSLQSCPTLYYHMYCSLSGSFVHGILQSRILEWVSMPSSRESSQPRIWTHISYISCIGGGWGGRSLPLVLPGKAQRIYKQNQTSTELRTK